MWFCWTDDIFFIWTHVEGKLRELIEGLNSFVTEAFNSYDHNNKNTMNIAKTWISVLDLKINLPGNKWITSYARWLLWCFEFSSSHPECFFKEVTQRKLTDLGMKNDLEFHKEKKRGKTKETRVQFLLKSIKYNSPFKVFAKFFKNLLQTATIKTATFLTSFCWFYC